MTLVRLGFASFLLTALTACTCPTRCATIPLLLDVSDGETGRGLSAFDARAMADGDTSIATPCSALDGAVECSALIERVPGNPHVMDDGTGWRPRAVVRMTVQISAEGYDTVSFPVEFSADECGAIGSQRWSVSLSQNGAGSADLVETVEACR